MTWAEFKAEIDKRLANAGRGDDVPLTYIRFESESGLSLKHAVDAHDGPRLQIWNA